MTRYGRHEDLLRLALLMQSSAEGVSLVNIETEFGVGRRTAERMRDAILNVYPQLEEIIEERGKKRWRFPTGTLGRMEDVTIDELASAHRALALVHRACCRSVTFRAKCQLRSVAGSVPPFGPMSRIWTV